MITFTEVANWPEKKLRTLRNNLNNRLESFSNKGDSVKELQKSHKLYNMNEDQCRELLKKIQDQLKK